MFFDVREVRRLLKTWTKIVDSRSNWVSRVEGKLLEIKPLIIVCKQRPFRFDESCRNRESRRNNRVSILDSRDDRESSVNFLLNGTVVNQVTLVTLVTLASLVTKDTLVTQVTLLNQVTLVTPVTLITLGTQVKLITHVTKVSWVTLDIRHGTSDMRQKT